jgi:hypothetical protein
MAFGFTLPRGERGPPTHDMLTEVAVSASFGRIERIPYIGSRNRDQLQTHLVESHIAKRRLSMKCAHISRREQKWHVPSAAIADHRHGTPRSELSSSRRRVNLPRNIRPGVERTFETRLASDAPSVHRSPKTFLLATGWPLA